MLPRVSRSNYGLAATNTPCVLLIPYRHHKLPSLFSENLKRHPGAMQSDNKPLRSPRLQSGGKMTNALSGCTLWIWKSTLSYHIPSLLLFHTKLCEDEKVWVHQKFPEECLVCNFTSLTNKNNKMVLWIKTKTFDSNESYRFYIV